MGVYYYVDGMSQAEIGKLLGVSGRTISTRIRQLSELARAAATPQPDASEPGGNP